MSEDTKIWLKFMGAVLLLDAIGVIAALALTAKH